MVATATQIIRVGGYETMTIRSLATQLGVSPMSLYRHVRDKDDLLGEVVDRLLADAWRPSQPCTNLRSWLAECAERLRSLLTSQPAALHVYLRGPVVSPAALERMGLMMAELVDALGSEPVARRIYAAIHTYTIGFAALEASRSEWTPTPDDSQWDLAVQLAAFTTPEQFAIGLELLLQAIPDDR